MEWAPYIDKDGHLGLMPALILAVVALVCGVAWIIMNRDIDKK